MCGGDDGNGNAIPCHEMAVHILAHSGKDWIEGRATTEKYIEDLKKYATLIVDESEFVKH